MELVQGATPVPSGNSPQPQFLRGSSGAGALLDQLPDMVLVIDARGALRYANPPVARLFGRPVEQLLGTNIVDLVLPDDRNTALEALEATTSHGPGVHDFPPLRVVAAGGADRIVELVANNLLDDPSVQGILISARDVTDLVQVRQQLEHQASHDALTTLPNRTLFQELGEQAIARARRQDNDVAILFLDLDQFKRVNDTYGHPVGDELLVQIGDRLRRALRRGDVVARFGGDEFVVLCEHPGEYQEIEELARRLIDAVSQPAPLGALVAKVGASIGIAIGGGERVTIHTLLRDADAALYQAKDQGRGRAVLFGAGRGPGYTADPQVGHEGRRQY